MAEQYGIVETKELVVGVNELALVLVKHLKDGAQLTDVMAVIDDFKTNPDLLAKIMAAKDKIEQVPAEVQDISLMEGAELGMVQLAYLPKLISAAAK